MKKSKNVPAVGPELSLQEFEAERDQVCGDFADLDLAKQPGQLGRSEYMLVGILLAVSFALVLILQ